MIILPNQKDKTKYIMIAENKSDMDVLKFLYHSHCTFGLYKIYQKEGDKSRSGVDYKFLSQNFPLAYGAGYFNKIENYVPESQR